MKTTKNERNIAPKDYDIALLNYMNNKHDQLSDAQKEILSLQLPDLDTDKLTLGALCEALGVSVPERLMHLADRRYNVAFRSKRVKSGDISLVIRSSEDFCTTELEKQYQESLEKGAALVIMGRDEFEKLGIDEETAPVILMDYPNERIFRLFTILKKQNKAKTVMLTGSVGKTTTKDICYTVSQYKFRTYANENNTNTPHQVAHHLFYKAAGDNEIFIHEAGAGYFGSVRFSAAMLRPDILVLTNVYSHHLQVYKTFDNIFADKVSGDDYLSDDGIVITNYDDENIRNHTFKHTVKSFAIRCEDADYVAKNIRQKQEYLSFDVYEKATQQVTPVKVKILGEHNVYNILAAFVLGKSLGMSDTEIREALREYEAVGVRQNLTNVGGIHLLMDCYNVAEESIVAMLNAGANFDLDASGKRLALVGGENKLGKNVRERSEAFAQQLKDIKIDRYLFCGTEDNSTKALNHFGDAKSIMKGFKKISSIPATLSNSIDDMVAFLDTYAKRNDLVMVKGIYYLQMPIAVDKVFGTSFSFALSHNKASMVDVQDGKTKANLIEDFGELELASVPVNDGVLTIPDSVKQYPVFRVKDNAFAGKSVESIDFGHSIKNIGANAFANCALLKEVHIPKNVKVLDKGAFSNCENLVKVTIEEGLTHISGKVFAGCTQLKEVVVPVSVGMIEDNAFQACSNVQIVCEENSFAHAFALENNLKFVLNKVVPQETPKEEEKGSSGKLARKLRNIWKAIRS